MSVDFKKLKSFVKIIDTGSLSRAANIVRIAQPALSRQISELEAHFKQKLLIRSNHGISPTEAGLILYRHAQSMLKHLEQAETDVTRAAGSLAGHVSIGLATYSTTAALSLPLLRAVKERYPDIVLYINDNFGHVLSELVMTGKMDMAILYSDQPISGALLDPLFREEMFLIAPASMSFANEADDHLPLAALDGVPLMLPGRTHFLRQLIDVSFTRARSVPRVVAEIESVVTLRSAIDAGLGATILPWSVAESLRGDNAVTVRRLTNPAISATISLCISDHLPLSEPAAVVHNVLKDLVASYLNDNPAVGLSAPALAPRRPPKP